MINEKIDNFTAKDIMVTIFELNQKMDNKFQRIEDKLENRFNRVDDKFDKIDDRFVKIEERLNRIEIKTSSMESQIKMIYSVSVATGIIMVGALIKFGLKSIGLL